MSSVSISKSVNDTKLPSSATYVNLYNWPESGTEFTKTAGLIGEEGRRQAGLKPRIVDSVSCRQLYLKSYTFTRKETVAERTKKYWNGLKETVTTRRMSNNLWRGRDGACRYSTVKRVKELSRSALCTIFHRLLSCSATIDVVDNRD